MIVILILSSSSSSLSTDRPVIESMPSDQTVLEGGSAVFDCVSRGTPPLSVTWLHNAVPLVADDQSTSINSKCFILRQKRTETLKQQKSLNHKRWRCAVKLITFYE